MIYQQKIPTVEAYQIFAAGQALPRIPGSRIATPREGEDWAVEWDIERDGKVIPNLHLGGKSGDLLIPVDDSARVEPAATFFSQWETPPITLRAPDLRSSDLRG